MGFRPCYRRAASRVGRSTAFCPASYGWPPSPPADHHRSGSEIQGSPGSRWPASAAGQQEATDKLRRRIVNASWPDPRGPQRLCGREAADGLLRQPANATTWLEVKAPASRRVGAARTIAQQRAPRGRSGLRIPVRRRRSSRRFPTQHCDILRNPSSVVRAMSPRCDAPAPRGDCR